VAPGATALVSRPSHGAKHVPRGTAFTFGVSEPATVTIAIDRAAPGHVKHGQCVAPHHTKHCTRYLPKGSLVRSEPGGQITVPFTGRMGQRALKPGRYRATLNAVDAAQNASLPATIGFKIVHR
jgi:hypothetical protein